MSSTAKPVAAAAAASSEIDDAFVAALNDASITEPKTSIVAMDTLRRYCHGASHTKGPFPLNYWLVPAGKSSVSDTRCRHCVELFGFQKGSYLNQYHDVNCDSALDPVLTKMQYGGFKVGLSRLNDNDVPLYLDPENRHKSKEGVGIFVVPTQTEFQIIIDRAIGTFTIEDAMAGDEKIVINGGRKLYYDGGRAIIRGFATDSDRSFLFVAPSEWEKANAPEARVAATLSESNIFTLKLQPYTRKPKDEMVRLSGGFGGKLGGGGGGGYRGGESSSGFGGFGLSPRMPQHTYGGHVLDTFSSPAVTGFGGGGGGAGNGTSTFCAAAPSTTGGFGYGGGATNEIMECQSSDFFGSAKKNAAVGGATVSGGTHIGHVQTQAAKDKYTEYGEPIFIKIQLVCRQTDEHRKRDNLRARLQQDGLDYWSNEAKRQMEMKTYLEKEIAEMVDHLSKRLAGAKDDWKHAVNAASAVVNRNAALLEHLSGNDVTCVQLDPRPTAQVKADIAARDIEKKNSMLLDV